MRHILRAFPLVVVSLLLSCRTPALPAPTETSEEPPVEMPPEEMTASCGNGAQDAGELGVDCGGSCTTPCEMPVVTVTCSDGIKNGEETDVDCGASCAGQPCAPMQACASPADCASRVCDSSQCQAPTCADGIANGEETGSDCGLTACGTTQLCPPMEGCAHAEDCDSGVCGADNLCSNQSCQCAAPSCTDAVLNGDETDEDCGGSCAAQGFTCALTNTCESGSDCSSLSCGAGGTCEACVLDCPGELSCTNGVCACQQGKTMCGTECLVLTEDRNNCGACGNVCPANQVCNVGRCLDASTCLTGAACDGHCVDRSTSNEHCGVCAGPSGPTGALNGTGNCAKADLVCNYGECVAPYAVFNKLAKCEGGGPPINFAGAVGATGGSGSTCAGSVAATKFRWGVCSCTDFSITQDLLIDGFDSRVGPYAATGVTGRLGAGLAANGIIDAGIPSALSVVFGDVRASRTGAHQATTSPETISVKNMTVYQRTYANDVFNSNGTSFAASHASVFRGDMFIAGNINSNNASQALADLYSDTYSSDPNGFNVAGSVVAVTGLTGPSGVAAQPPCDCSDPLDIAGIIAAHACSSGVSGPTGCSGDNNDNFAAGADPALLASTSGDGVRIDLECGHYYFNSLTAGVDTTIFVHGNVAIYVGGNIATTKPVTFMLDPTAQLDVFVAGTLATTQASIFGNKNYPANMRMYIAGGTPGGVDINITQTVGFALNLYAPYGSTAVTQTNEIFGSVFSNGVSATQPWKVHFDRAVSSVGQICSSCGDGTIGAGEQCEGANLNGQNCQMLGYTSGTLGCDASTCRFVNNCVSEACGDGVKNGAEQCDTNDGVPSCTDLGFTMGTTSCNAECEVVNNCSNATGPSCGDGMRNGTEVCEGTDFGGASTACTSYTHNPPYTSGSVTCSGTCQLSFAQCRFCGDGVISGSEECDGARFPANTTCSSETEGALPSGSLSCSPTCTIVTSGCVLTGQCSTCDDCEGQACSNGTCGLCRSDSDCCSPFTCLAGGCGFLSPQ